MVFCINTRHPIHRLRDEMDRLITGFARGADHGVWPSGGSGRLAANVWEDGDTLTVEMELPGVTSDQLDISVVGGELTVEIHRSDDKEEGVVYHRRERSSGDLRRVLRLPADIDSGKVKAGLHNGILTISLPKAESAKPRRIDVQSG